MVNRSQQRTMKRRSGGDVSDRRGARALNGSHSATATNIAILDLRLRSHRKKDTRSERGDHEPTRVGIHKCTSGLIFYALNPPPKTEFRHQLSSRARSPNSFGV